MQQKPRVFTKNIGGQQQTQLAYTAADAVALAYSGWRETAPRTLDHPATGPAAPATAPANPTVKAQPAKAAASSATEKTR